MNRGIWIAVALLAAAPALGQDQAKKDTTAGTKAATTPKQGGKKAGSAAKGAGKKQPEPGASSAWGTGGSSKSSVAAKKATAAPAHAAERAAMLRARQLYRYAAESCQQSAKDCDKALRDDTESQFIDACLPCATREQCEAERDLIRAGNAKTTTSLCSE